MGMGTGEIVGEKRAEKKQSRAGHAMSLHRSMRRANIEPNGGKQRPDRLES